jgi:peptidoglycan hydrolase CwlO-like protein
MSNTELILCIETLQNEFDAKKSELIKICGEIEEIQRKYNDANREINSRKNVF